MYNRIVFENCYVYAGIKVEMKRRWNYKIPWPLTRFSWPPTFLASPSKICCQPTFSENINKLITK